MFFFARLCVNLISLSVNDNIGRIIGNHDDIDNLNDINEPHASDSHLIGGIGVIHLPSAVWNVVFYIMSTMVQLLQLKGIFSLFGS